MFLPVWNKSITHVQVCGRQGSKCSCQWTLHTGCFIAFTLCSSWSDGAWCRVSTPYGSRESVDESPQRATEAEMSFNSAHLNVVQALVTFPTHTVHLTDCSWETHLCIRWSEVLNVGRYFTWSIPWVRNHTVKSTCGHSGINSLEGDAMFAEHVLRYSLTPVSGISYSNSVINNALWRMR